MPKVTERDTSFKELRDMMKDQYLANFFGVKSEELKDELSRIKKERKQREDVDEEVKKPSVTPVNMVSALVGMGDKEAMNMLKDADTEQLMKMSLFLNPGSMDVKSLITFMMAKEMLGGRKSGEGSNPADSSEEMRKMLKDLVLIERLSPKKSNDSDMVMAMAKLAEVFAKRSEESSTSKGDFLALVKLILDSKQNQGQISDVLRLVQEYNDRLSREREESHRKDILFLAEKIKDLRDKQINPADYLSSIRDEMEMFRGMFGEPNIEAMKLQQELEREKLALQKEMMREAKEDKRLEKIISTADKFVERVGGQLGSQVGEAITSRIAGKKNLNPGVFDLNPGERVELTREDIEALEKLTPEELEQLNRIELEELPREETVIEGKPKYYVIH